MQGGGQEEENTKENNAKGSSAASKLSQVVVFAKCQRFVRFPIFREVKICQEKDKYKGMCTGVLV